MRHWKISEGDYSERKLWPDYMEAYEEAMEKTSTKHAPWYVIPSNHKWFRNLAISEILADTLEDMDLKLPPAQVDIEDIRHKYHAAASNQARYEPAAVFASEVSTRFNSGVEPSMRQPVKRHNLINSCLIFI